MKKLVSCILALVFMCGCMAGLATDYAPMDFSENEAAAANLFLSNFTEVGVTYLGSFPSDKELVDFAHDHLWFNDYDSFEYGEYFGDNNCRVPDDRIQEIVDKYFYYKPKRVELSETRFDYRDGYYYHCETGGWINSGFAHVTQICPLDENIYYMSFMVFGGGNHWTNDVMRWSLSEINSEFGYISGYGAACVYATDLSDRSTYKLISFAMLN